MENKSDEYGMLMDISAELKVQDALKANSTDAELIMSTILGDLTKISQCINNWSIYFIEKVPSTINDGTNLQIDKKRLGLQLKLILDSFNDVTRKLEFILLLIRFFVPKVTERVDLDTIFVNLQIGDTDFCTYLGALLSEVKHADVQTLLDQIDIYIPECLKNAIETDQIRGLGVEVATGAFAAIDDWGSVKTEPSLPSVK